MLFMVAVTTSEPETTTTAVAAEPETITPSSDENETWFDEDKQAISYDAIKRGNLIPCNGIYKENCHKSEEAHHYKRPCSLLNTCERGGEP